MKWWITTGIVSLLLLPLLPFVAIIWSACLMFKALNWSFAVEGELKARERSQRDGFIRQAIRGGH